MGIIRYLSNYFIKEDKEEAVRRRQRVLDGLAEDCGFVGLVPFEAFERKARIYKTRNDLSSFKLVSFI